MSLIDNDYQTALLFKQFVGVAAARLDDEFSVEKFRSVPNIFSNDVMIEDIPSSAPYKISGSNGLDASSNWLDSSCNYGTNSVEESTYAGPGPNNGKTFAEMFPDTHLKFYKRLSLVPCEQNSNGRVWGSFTDYNGTPMYANKQSVLKHAIPFKYDDINATYSPIVRYNRIQGGNGAGTSTPNFQDTAINSFPLYWIMDAGTGFLQFYQTQTNLEAAGVKDIKISSIQDKDWAPEISLFVYNGKKGITNLDVSGQVQVGDISGVSKITEEIERMVILDGSAVVTQIDLCGNDTLRAQYEYIRKNLFIGYPTQPILTDYQVDHDFDPSENGIYYELDVSGNSYISGNVDISSNLGVTGTLSVDGNIQGDSNANIAGNLFVDGIIESIDGTRFVDYRNYNSDISGSIMGSGNSQWFCIAKIEPSPAGEFANGLFILDDDTSGLRQSIVFRAGSSYARGNFVDVLSNHYYSGPRVTGMRIDVSGNNNYQGANLYIQRGYTTNPTRLFIRVYQNKRKGSDGTNVGWWQLTSTPVPNLLATKVTLNLDFQPSGIHGGSKATTLDTLIDAEFKVNGKTTLTDLSATNISTTSNVIVDGDLTVNGYTTIQNGRFIDISGKELDIKDTNILVKSDSPESYLPQTVPGTEYFEIAFINQNSIAPGTNNTVASELASPLVEIKTLQQIKSAVRKAYQALNLQDGPGHIELITTDQQEIFFIEAAGRGGGFMVFDKLVPTISGVNIALATALNACGKKVSDLMSNRISPRYSAVLRFIPSKPGTVIAIDGFDSMDKIANVEAEPFVRLGDVMSDAAHDGDRMGYILSTSKTPIDAQKLANKAEKLLTIKVT